MSELHPLILLFTGLFWSVMGLVGAYMAEARGRNPWVWFAVGVLFWPAILALFLLPNLKKELSEPRGELERQLHAAVIDTSRVLSNDYFNTHVWYYLNDAHTEEGPVEFGFIRELWLHKKLTENSYLWHEGMDDWKQVGTLPGLKEALSTH